MEFAYQWVPEQMDRGRANKRCLRYVTDEDMYVIGKLLTGPSKSERKSSHGTADDTALHDQPKQAQYEFNA